MYIWHLLHTLERFLLILLGCNWIDNWQYLNEGMNLTKMWRKWILYHGGVRTNWLTIRNLDQGGCRRVTATSRFQGFFFLGKTQYYITRILRTSCIELQINTVCQTTISKLPFASPRRLYSIESGFSCSKTTLHWILPDRRRKRFENSWVVRFSLFSDDGAFLAWAQLWNIGRCPDIVNYLPPRTRRGIVLESNNSPKDGFEA